MKSTRPERTGHTPARAQTPLAWPASEDTGDWVPLHRVGRYILTHALGRGAMGAVYAAYDPDLDRPLAIKILHGTEEDSAVEQAQHRLAIEAQCMARLDHPNVLTVFDVGRVGERLYLAMELNRGQNLRQWYESEPRDWCTSVRVLLAAGRGLQAAHCAGLVHRDFKPENILIDGDHRVRITDFGLVLAKRDLPAGANSNGVGATACDGTPAYMAPEQHLGEGVDARSDQFAFCVTLYEFVYGARPFVRPFQLEVLESMADGPQFPTSGRTAPPRWLRDCLQRGLSFHARDRYPDMTQLLDDIASGLRQYTQYRARRKGWYGLALATAMLVWGGTSYATRVRPCDEFRVANSSLWTVEKSSRVADIFAASKSPAQARGFERVDSILSDYSDQWSAVRLELCVQLRGGNGPRMADAAASSLRQPDAVGRCLELRAEQLKATITVLLDADAQAARDAPMLLDALVDPAVCLEGERYSARFPVPERAELRAAVEQVRATLARAETMGHAGLSTRAAELATVALRRARTLDYPILHAEAQFTLGFLQMLNSENVRARDNLQSALELALRLGRDEVAARASTGLVFMFGLSPENTERARAMMALARVQVARMQDRPDLLAEWLNNSAVVLGTAGEHEESEMRYREALELHGQGERTSALTQSERINNLAIALLGQGRDEEATEMYRWALSSSRDFFGPNHPKTVYPLMNLGSLLSRRGYFDEGVSLLLEADAIVVQAHGPRAPQRAWTCNFSIDPLLRLHRFDQALYFVDTYLAIDSDPIGVVGGKFGHRITRAMILAIQGHRQAASDAYERSRSLFSQLRAGGRPLRMLAWEARQMARLAHLLRHHAEARTWLERGRELRTLAGPAMVEDARFDDLVAAQIAVDTGAFDSALELLRMHAAREPADAAALNISAYDTEITWARAEAGSGNIEAALGRLARLESLVQVELGQSAQLEFDIDRLRGDWLAQLGRHDAAVVAWTRALAWYSPGDHDPELRTRLQRRLGQVERVAGL